MLIHTLIHTFLDWADSHCFLAYMVCGVITAGVVAFLEGTSDKKDDEGGMWFVSIFFWPFFAFIGAIVVFCAPFALLHKLGQVAAHK